MSSLIILALAPIFIIIFYVYIRDKYEKEPIHLLLTSILFSCLITIPIIKTEAIVSIFIPNKGVLIESLYVSFLASSLVEEFYKYIVLYFLIWKNKNFNERFDGIVYSVFISLGFAGIENIVYVLNPRLGGFKTAFLRAIFSVPGHALFGVFMGYYFALSKYEKKYKNKYFIYAFFIPWFLHAIYNFILTFNSKYTMIIFIPFNVFICRLGLQKMNIHINSSPFKNS